MMAIIYAVRDELQKKYHNPIFIPDSDTAKAQAIRLFKSQIENTTIWRENPADFSLWTLGAIDDGTGTIVSNVEKITDGRSVLNGGES